MSLPHTVAFLGFGEFERGALASYFRLAGKREPCYEQVTTLTDADFLVADSDHAPSVQLVTATERLAETVFIGPRAPAGASVWMARPIDPLHVMRELDAMVALGSARPAAAAPAAAANATPAGASAPARAPALAPARARAPAPTPAAASALATPAQRQRPADVPVALQATAAVAPPVPSRPMKERRRHPRPSRALIVDDSEIAQRFLETRLQPWGLKTDRAGNSEQATELLDQHSYDMVFLDVELGDGSSLDGLELCQQIKNSPAAVSAQVIIVSAHHSELDRVRGALAGCDAYLAKPLEPQELERLLRRRGLKAPAQRA